MKKILSLILVLLLISSVISGCGGAKNTPPEVQKSELNLGNMIDEIKGNTNVSKLEFATEDELLLNMQLACQNDKFELYYSIDNMVVALKDKTSGKIMLSNPYNAALDDNYSGNVANRLDSQVIVTYLEEEKSLVDMYSAVDCANLGQYTAKTYENGLSFQLSIGEEKDGNNVPKVLSKKRYEELYNTLSNDSKELLEMYYVLYSKDDLKNTNIYDVYPEIKVNDDLHYCYLELSEREMRKVSGLFTEANYTADMMAADAEELNLGTSYNSYPNFKLTLNYTLTDNGVKVTIPNESISYNEDFPLLKISLLPYFGSDESVEYNAVSNEITTEETVAEDPTVNEVNGYLFIPDGTGAVINMNQNDPNCRRIITGKVYGENSSTLPKKQAVEKTEQYYLPVFGTVRNNNTALFGIISSGDANAEITALLGRPNGNYYTTYPEFIVADFEKYTRISVVSNAWSNKEMYLYDKNKTQDDLSVEYTFLKDDKANYSAMAKIYSDYIYKGKNEKIEKSVLNIETLGSVLTDKTFLGFDYISETVLTAYKENIEILKQLKKEKATNLSLQLKGWQKDGLDTVISNKVRISSKLGSKANLNKLIKYCNDEKINLSLYNNISFVKYDDSGDGFKTKTDATRTLELQYAFKTELSPATMESLADSFVVKASSYNRYLDGLTNSAKKLENVNLNLGVLGTFLNADYTKDKGINRGEALRYIKETIEAHKKEKLSFDGGNAYVLPFAKTVSYISNENSGFIGESASVPFLQLVIGDRATYNSRPINLEENTRYELLKCIESGTVPTFLLSYDNTSKLKITAYTEYFSVDYEILKEEVIDSYKYVEEVVSKTKGTSIKEHKILAKDVTVTTYENGTKVYVNKSDNDYKENGITVKTMDYLIKE